jgi:hypothetical protein
MKYVPLDEFCKPKGGKAEASRLLKHTQHAIKKMLDAGRHITLVFDNKGAYVCFIELKTTYPKEAA